MGAEKEVEDRRIGGVSRDNWGKDKDRRGNEFTRRNWDGNKQY